MKFPGKVRRNLLKLKSAQNSEIVHLIKDMTYKMEIDSSQLSRKRIVIVKCQLMAWICKEPFYGEPIANNVQEVFNMPNKKILFNMVYFNHVNLEERSHVAVRLYCIVSVFCDI